MPKKLKSTNLFIVVNYDIYKVQIIEGNKTGASRIICDAAGIDEYYLDAVIPQLLIDMPGFIERTVKQEQ